MINPKIKVRLFPVLLRTGTYAPLARAFRYTRILTREARAIRKNKSSDEALSVAQQGNIAMFHAGRSGSTVLGDLLGRHPNIFWDGEIYVGYFQKWRKKRVLNGAQDFLDEAVQLLRRGMTHSPKPFYGFEVHSYHLQVANVTLQDYIERINDMGISHFIILVRKNILRKILSAIIAQKISQYHQGLQKEVALTRIDINIKNLVERLQNQYKYYSMLEDLLKSRKVLRLTYEDDIQNDPLVGYKRICQFLDIEYIEARARLGRTNPFNLSDMILNFGEVERTLRGTPFEWMLYD
jgi:hypothetical protein